MAFIFTNQIKINRFSSASVASKYVLTFYLVLNWQTFDARQEKTDFTRDAHHLKAVIEMDSL